MSQFVANLEEIFTGASAGSSARWSLCDFVDKVLVAQSSICPQYWPGVFPSSVPGTAGGRTRPMPGLADDTPWDGVEVLSGHVLLWREASLLWSDVNDFTMWIPVKQTAVSARRTVSESFPQPGTGGTTDWVYLDGTGSVFAVGQYVRIDLNPDDPLSASYNFYLVEKQIAAEDLESTTIAAAQEVSPGVPTKLFITEYANWDAGARMLLADPTGGDLGAAQVTSVSGKMQAEFLTTEANESVPPVGQAFYVTLSGLPTGLQQGDIVSLCAPGESGLDLYRVAYASTQLSLINLGVGDNLHSIGFRCPANTTITIQPWVEVKSSASLSIPAGSVLSPQAAVKLRALGYTGEIAAGTMIDAGSVAASVDANEAGALENVGSDINGPIWAVVALGDWGLILKERSIQMIQPVAREQGVFAPRLVVPEEGLIARNAWCRMLKDGKTASIAYWGHTGIYIYTGGQEVTQIAPQHYLELVKELDKGRADEIVMYHQEDEKLLWCVYPVLGSANPKVLIYDTAEGGVTVDEYDGTFGDITAVGAIDWETGPTWNDLADSRVWNTETLRWRELVEDGLQRYTFLGISADQANTAYGEAPSSQIPRLLVHGRRYARTSSNDCAPAAYRCSAETPDFDFGDNQRWKYVDTLFIDLDVRDDLSTPMKLWVQFGARDTLDKPIRWTAAKGVEASGKGTQTTKVNILASGRYLRVRFFSEAVDAHWRIAGYRFQARTGGTF